MQGAINPR